MIKDSTSEKLGRGVSFGSIAIREYPRCLGDHPDTRNGPPLTIDWLYEDTGMISVEDYETSRPERRLKEQMLLPGYLRQSMLLETGTTMKEICTIRTQIKTAQHQRNLSRAMQEYEHFYVVVESLKRKLRRFHSGISKKREMELLWENVQRPKNDQGDTVKTLDESMGSLSATKQPLTNLQKMIPARSA